MENGGNESEVNLFRLTNPLFCWHDISKVMKIVYIIVFVLPTIVFHFKPPEQISERCKLINERILSFDS